jgi:hypothetical protein
MVSKKNNINIWLYLICNNNTGSYWDAFTHDDSRKRAYRWGEDGLLGITDKSKAYHLIDCEV